MGWVSGASMILRRTMLEQIGLLDEGLYTYCDDVDICLRARRAGWETWYVPESRVVHLAGASTGIASHTKRPVRRPPYWYQAHHRYFLKNYGAFVHSARPSSVHHRICDLADEAAYPGRAGMTPRIC